MTRILSAHVGIDVGGTFTDFCVVGEGGRPLGRFKLLSTPADPAAAVIEGLRRIAGTWPDAALEVVHGTTVATNAVLTRRGVRCGLVLTRGFGDLLLLGRQQRRGLYRLDVSPRALPVEGLEVLEVAERNDARCGVLIPLADGELSRAAEWAERRGIESAAVCLLHAAANPEHESRLAAALRSGGRHVSVSHEVLPRPGEYERAATTLLDAYVTPVVAGYLRRIEEAGRGLGLAGLRVMRSDGGLMGAAEAAARGVETVLSGPAGGLRGAMLCARCAGFKRVLAFDMGGTSTDVCFLDGEPSISHECEIDGFPCAVPAVDVHTVGAGGGSIAWIDAGGALRVGPQSAGADPGPACYGIGEEPTVTDAHVALGTIPVDGDHGGFAGGAIRLDRERAREAVGRLASRLGLGVDDCASGILAVADAVMDRALRRMSLARGHEPEGFALLAFGGAGPLHAASLARKLGSGVYILPPGPGVLSAFGMAWPEDAPWPGPDRGPGTVRESGGIPVVPRGTLGAGDELAGPAILIDDTATALLAAGDRGRVDAAGNLIVRVGVEA